MADLAGARYLLFRLADLTCAAHVASVAEILPVPAARTRIPGAPPEIAGVINVRGSLVTLVDGRRVLGLDGGERRSVVLLDAGARTLGLAVDEVLDLVTIAAEDVADREALPGVESRFVKGVARHGNSTLVVVDTNALIAWALPT